MAGFEYGYVKMADQEDNDDFVAYDDFRSRSDSVPSSAVGLTRSPQRHHHHGRRRSHGVLPSHDIFGGQDLNTNSYGGRRRHSHHGHLNITDFLRGVPIDPAPSYEMSSPNSSEESLTDIVGALKDPYKVTLHYITNPGQSLRLRKLLEPLIKCFDPSFKLFNIAERSRSNGLSADAFDISETEYPALGVVLFLLKDDDENEFDDSLIIYSKLDRAHDHLCKRPWRNHHFTCLTDNFSVYRENRQDFYTTDNDIPLWAVRQVHHGKEHLRFMIYSTHERWDDMVQFYSLLVGRKAEYERDDFCYFLIHSKELMDIQLALKKVPHGCHPKALNSAFLQIKVREIGELVPLLPNACSPISPQRWQTNDPDGNVTLLLVNRKQLSTSMSGGTGTIQQKPRLLLRQQSTDVLQTLVSPKAFRPMARLSPRIHLAPVSDDDENRQ